LKAELLAIGSELLGPLRAETNSLWLTERLLDAGIEVSAARHARRTTRRCSSRPSASHSRAPTS
jgi:molybdopterin-biosynthesis enzyme MoeA-like protein